MSKSDECGAMFHHTTAGGFCSRCGKSWKWHHRREEPKVELDVDGNIVDAEGKKHSNPRIVTFGRKQFHDEQGEVCDFDHPHPDHPCGTKDPEPVVHDPWAAVVALVDEQAEDEALWSVPMIGLQPISEAYLQQELRRLHAAVEQASGREVADAD